ncbi:Na+/H+ antiporter subunit E [Marinimicrococcus flavescens]|uniref:Na+/H+ antiporter subunit E n=1 Tax=Marinimicrococcus flavescens TaxID=3031815 RepID=A0AAP3UXI1_9PROT|nr:Na+/H+ antiporter subunit E [Marinimicrococcus flavescens]
MRSRLVPHPLLTLALTAVWLLLVNEASLGHLLLGLVLGLIVPLLTAAYWPGRPRVRRPIRWIEYGLVVLWDILVANVQVAYLVIFKRNDQLRPRFLTVPLELSSPEAITVLAGTITMTPGTVSADLSADGRALLVHALDTGDPQETARDIKQRYEARLKEIFR